LICFIEAINAPSIGNARFHDIPSSRPIDSRAEVRQEKKKKTRRVKKQAASGESSLKVINSIAEFF
jgi:hypothetical protein